MTSIVVAEPVARPDTARPAASADTRLTALSDTRLTAPSDTRLTGPADKGLRAGALGLTRVTARPRPPPW
jgi:hypothetical protein